MKRISKDRVNSEVASIMHDLKLNVVRSCHLESLTYGLRRMLCVAIAILAGSQVGTNSCISKKAT